MDDLFKNFFGRRSGKFKEDKRHDDFIKDFDDLRPDGGPYPDEHNHFPTEEEFFHDFRIPEPRDMFQHFEEILRNFGMAEFSVKHRDTPPGSVPSTPRDSMLKEPDSNGQSSEFGSQPFDSHRLPSRRPHHHMEPGVEVPFRMPSWFGRFDQLPGPSHHKQDNDLDKEVQDGNLDSILSDKDDKIEPRSSPQSFFRSTSVVTVRGPNGKVEHKRITRDGRGNEEATVTRSYGDQSHTVTTTTDQEGVRERVESFNNMDEKDLDSFEKRWSTSEQSPKSREDSMFKLPTVQYHDNQKGFFKKLFEYTFPGFAKPDK